MRPLTIRSTVSETRRSSISFRNCRRSSSIRPLHARPRETENSGSVPAMTTASGKISRHHARICGIFETPPVRNSSSGGRSSVWARTVCSASVNSARKLLPFRWGVPRSSSVRAVSGSIRSVSFAGRR